MTIKECYSLGKFHRQLAEKLTRTTPGEWLTTVLQFHTSDLHHSWSFRKTLAYNRAVDGKLIVERRQAAMKLRHKNHYDTVKLDDDEIIQLNGKPVPLATEDGPGGYVIRDRAGELKIVCDKSVCDKC